MRRPPSSIHHLHPLKPRHCRPARETETLPPHPQTSDLQVHPSLVTYVHAVNPRSANPRRIIKQHKYLAAADRSIERVATRRGGAPAHRPPTCPVLHLPASSRSPNASSAPPPPTRPRPLPIAPRLPPPPLATAVPASAPCPSCPRLKAWC